MKYETAFTKSIDTEEMIPEWTDQIIPRCSEKCPSHDGKRCELMGFRPDGICEPAVHEIALRAACAFDVAHLAECSICKRRMPVEAMLRPHGNTDDLCCDEGCCESWNDRAD